MKFLIELFRHWLIQFPSRSQRWLKHIFFPIGDPYLRYKVFNKEWFSFFLHYTIELPLVFFDMLAVPELFALFQKLFKSKSRALYEHELELARAIFGNTVDWHKVRIDENAKVGTHGGKYAFVTYYYINCIGSMSLPILIHELVHVLQFQQDGSRYAFRNMIAHLWPDTYNYGGIIKLEKIQSNPFEVHSLNYEQRADVFSDFARLLLGQRPEWGQAYLADGITYRKVINMLL